MSEPQFVTYFPTLANIREDVGPIVDKNDDETMFLYFLSEVAERYEPDMKLI